MKSSTNDLTNITKKHKTSFLLRFIKRLLDSSPDKKNMIVLLMLQRLSPDLLRSVTSFLPLRKNNQSQSTLITRNLMFLNKGLHQNLNEDYWIDKFRELIAIEGEDNQNQAEAILQRLLREENYGLMSKLLSIQRPMKDAAGRYFKSISAMGYTFWAGDTRMSRMLEKYINILEEKGHETKKLLNAECDHIEEQGIEFTFNGERIENSKHFDWQPLIEAYNAYIAAATPLINANDGQLNEVAWEPMDILWLNIGKELAKVPTHVAQEYCSKILFFPLSNFQAALNRPILNRTVKLNDRDSWFLRGAANPNLGPVFSILKGLTQVATSHKRMRWMFFMIYPQSLLLPVGREVGVDLAAITALSEMRTVNDRKQTLENLKSLAPVTYFHPVGF